MKGKAKIILILMFFGVAAYATYHYAPDLEKVQSDFQAYHDRNLLEDIDYKAIEKPRQIRP